MSDSDLRAQSKTFLTEFRSGLQFENLTDLSRPEWEPMKALLSEFSRTRAANGFSPTETATFVLSIRGVLMDCLQNEYGQDAAGLAAEMRTCSLLLDKLALYTADTALRSREELIKRQQEEMLELSTPVVKLFPGILGVPLIGTLDSERTQIVMENLLQEIVKAEASIAIIDITGVPTVDTLVAQHLLKTVSAARLMGADCIISGIRPQIAQTIVHLGIELNVATKATLADALFLALQKTGMTVQRAAKDGMREK
jgi:rsbT co-antagonist protein RsbR